MVLDVGFTLYRKTPSEVDADNALAVTSVLIVVVEAVTKLAGIRELNEAVYWLCV